jgi:glycosyltransferase involved in cell wall biosynthesis
MKRILHLVRDFSPPSQTFVYNLIVSLEESGNSANQVAYYRRRVLADERPFSPACFAGIDRSAVGRIKRILQLRTAGRARADALKRVIETALPDLIHCHFAWSAWHYLYDYARIFGLNRPIVITVHGTDVLRSLTKSDDCRRKLHALH